MKYVKKYIFNNKLAYLSINENFNPDLATILCLPGGSFTDINEERFESVLDFYGRSYNVAMLRYTLLHEEPHVVNEAYSELLTSIDFLKDVPRLYLLGFSAGGLLVANYFNSTNYQENLRGILLSYPLLELRYGITEKLDSVFKQDPNNELFQPISQLHPTKIPLFAWGAQNDQLTKIEVLLNYIQKNVHFSNSVEFHQFSKGKHGLLLASDLNSLDNKNIALWPKLSLNWISET